MLIICLLTGVTDMQAMRAVLRATKVLVPARRVPMGLTRMGIRTFAGKPAPTSACLARGLTPRFERPVCATCTTPNYCSSLASKLPTPCSLAPEITPEKITDSSDSSELTKLIDAFAGLSFQETKLATYGSEFSKTERLIIFMLDQQSGTLTDSFLKSVTMPDETCLAIFAQAPRLMAKNELFEDMVYAKAYNIISQSRPNCIASKSKIMEAFWVMLFGYSPRSLTVCNQIFQSNPGFFNWIIGERTLNMSCESYKHNKFTKYRSAEEFSEFLKQYKKILFEANDKYLAGVMAESRKTINTYV